MNFQRIVFTIPACGILNITCVLQQLINDCIRDNNLMKGHYKLKLMYIGRTFTNFCKLFSLSRKFTKMQVVNKDTSEFTEINMNVEDGCALFLNYEQLFNFIDNESELNDKFKLSYVSSVGQGFKNSLKMPRICTINIPLEVTSLYRGRNIKGVRKKYKYLNIGLLYALLRILFIRKR